MVDDIIAGGFGIINKLIEVHAINEWFKILFGFGFSFFTTFCVACGKSLVAGTPYSISIGYGLLAGAGSMMALFMLHPKTRGIIIAQDKNNMPDISNYQTLEKKK